ncbi:MAG: phosphoglycerate mutase family protein [Reichenbachiella sp.]|uniref:SixA phosphatase family protein n=1 Tax=Reichenbachiella sp. TaxID=2184521 RepID=UPI0032995D42
MKYLIYVFFSFALITSCSQKNEEPFTIYLVRHAEKDVSDKTNSDPTLTPCGEERAKSLAVFFDQVALEKVYSSDYIRTKDTANPTAESKNKDLTLYNPDALNAIAQVLLERKENALVVGHSNTTGVLAGLLCDQKIEPFDESIYNRIYQVVISDKTAQLQVFHTAFSCE